MTLWFSILTPRNISSLSIDLNDITSNPASDKDWQISCMNASLTSSIVIFLSWLSWLSCRRTDLILMVSMWVIWMMKDQYVVWFYISQTLILVESCREHSRSILPTSQWVLSWSTIGLI